MLCDICHSKPARVLYKEIINGECKEQHLCEDCAREYASFSLKNKLGSEIPLSNILSGILSTYAKDAVASSIDQKQCPGCGITFEQFRKSGKLGCALCYETFERIIDKNLKNIQGANRHNGKKPVNGETPVMPANMKTKANEAEMSDADDAVTAAALLAGFGGGQEDDGTEELRRRMAAAVKAEDYAEAARLRDLIKAKEKADGFKNGTV